MYVFNLDAAFHLNLKKKKINFADFLEATLKTCPPVKLVTQIAMSKEKLKAILMV